MDYTRFSQFCVPTAIAYLTGFTRKAAAIGLVNKVGAQVLAGGVLREDYMRYLRTLPKSLVELGKTERVGMMASNIRYTGTLLVSGGIRKNGRLDRNTGHCFIIYNGLLFDNHTTATPIHPDYACHYITPVIHSQMHATLQRLNEAYKKVA